MKFPTSTAQNILLVQKQLILRNGLRVLAGILALNISIGHAESQKVKETSETQTLAASVNGVPIKLDELAPQVHVDLRKYKKYGIRPQDDDLLKALRMQALEKLISVELIYQEARKLKIDNLDERVSEKLSEIQEQNGEHEGFDEKKTRDTLTKNILIDEYLIRNKLKNTEPPESEVKAYYEENRKAFTRNESVRTRHILTSMAADATPEEKVATRKKIEEARKLILDGKPFDEIAKTYSDCNSASGGGELGYQERGYMPQAFDEIAFSLETGKLSGIIETEFGYHILEVLDHKSAGIQPYEEVKDFIGRYLKIQLTKTAMDGHISALRKNAKIDIYL